MPAITWCVPSTLKQTGFYQRLKNSRVRDLYWRIADKTLLDGRREQVDFYRNLLQGFQEGELVFDVGANVGEKTDIFLRLGARVVAVEPDARNQEVLRSKFLKYRLVPRPVVLVAQAMSDKVGVEKMWIDGPGSALNTLSQKWADSLRADKKRFEHSVDAMEFAEERNVETTTLDQLIAVHGVPFFIKIDVEGHELQVLKGMRQPVPYVSFEVNLPEFKNEALECLGLLEGLAVSGKFNYVTDCRSGLVLDRWVNRQQLSQILDRCSEKCIEVFCRTQAGSGHADDRHSGESRV
jgi:FkbM family methyltransferase